VNSNAVQKLSIRIDGLASKGAPQLQQSDSKPSVKLESLKTPPNNLKVAHQKNVCSIQSSKNYHPKENNAYFAKS
jgi:hypothetical protein